MNSKRIVRCGSQMSIFLEESGRVRDPIDSVYDNTIEIQPSM